MKYRRSQKFLDDFKELPKEIQEATKDKFTLFKDDISHPSLRIKKMQGHDDIWEGHITVAYVFTFEREIDPESGEETIIFRRIGTHDIYKKP